MHKNFAEWYRLVSLEPDGTKLAKRWAGVKAWAAALRRSDENALETVRIYRGLPNKSSREPFLDAFRKADPAFPQRNELELQVLAGASLLECVTSPGGTTEGFRTALLAGAALETSKLRVVEPRLEEIAQEVSMGLRTVAINQRKRRPIYPDNLLVEAGDQEDAISQLSSAPDTASLKTAIKPILEAFVSGFASAAEEIRDVKHNLRCADEETNILWWIEGRCSRDLNKPWASLKEAAATIAGMELADLTDVALGPLEATAVLERVLKEASYEGGDKNTQLEFYVNALPEEWTTARAAKLTEHALDLMPIAHAISLRSKSDATSWQHYFETTSPLKQPASFTESSAARQAYFEAVLVRILKKDGVEE